MISHRNVISNVLQITTYESPQRARSKRPGSKNVPSEVALGLLPQSHIYSLVVICHASTYRGDQVITLPKFELHQYLESIQRFKINALYLVSLLYFRITAGTRSWSKCRPIQVPPIIINMIKNKSLCDKYDLSSVTILFTGAAPLGEETANDFQKQYPDCKIRQGYGKVFVSSIGRRAY